MNGYMDIFEISEKIKRPEPKKDAMALYPGNTGFTSKTPYGATFAKEMKVSNSGKTLDLKDVECFKCHKKGNYAKKMPGCEEQ